MIDKYLKITKKIATACGVFAAASIMLSIVLVTELVLERYIFGNAITWQPELVTHLLVASTFIGSAYVFAENGHVNMDYFYTFLSVKRSYDFKNFYLYSLFNIFFNFILCFL